MDICLINPSSPFLIDQDVMPPLGLWYLSAELKAAGYDVVVVDLGLGDEIPEAPIYGVTGVTAQLGEMVDLVDILRDINPDAWLIAGGSHATIFPHEMLFFGYDTVVRGEGEMVIAPLLSWESRRDVMNFATTPIRLNSDVLNSLEFPDRSQAHRYHYTLDGRRATTIMTSRGCPYNCAFCSKQGTSGRLWVPHTPDRVVAEIKEIKELGFDAFMAYDDTIAMDARRLLRICRGLEDIDVKWRCFARAAQMTQEVARAMVKSGCVEVGIGVESGSASVLETIMKAETPHIIAKGIRTTQDAGMRAKCFFIVGLPGETKETIAETEAFIEEVRPDDVDFTVLSVLGGSPIYDKPERFDVQWGMPVAYKGKPGEYTTSTRTSMLSREELLAHRDRLEKQYKEW
uniref:Putative radical SAM superfamily protein n=1 Tax=viral metagenome TaxID=1070528 RepID=A0A6M3XDE0_9ZZZZ